MKSSTMHRQILFGALAMAAFVALMPRSSSAVLATLTDDTYVTDASPSIHGTKATLKVQDSPTHDSSAYVKFNLGNLPAGVAAADIDKAILTVFVSKLSGTGAVSVFEADPTSFPGWNESSLNTTNAPATLGSALQTVTPASKFEYVNFDVTAAVLDWVTTPAHNNGLVLTPGTGANLLFESKESKASGHAPALQFTLKTSVTSANIVDGTIQNADIANSTIQGGKIASGTINGSNIASSTITGSNVASGTITGGNIASSTITSGNIGTNTIQGFNIALGTIFNTNLANSSVTINSGTGLTGGGTVSLGGTTTMSLATGGVTSTQILDGTIATADIANSAVTGAKIATGAISAGNIQNNTITGGKIAFNTIDDINIIHPRAYALVDPSGPFITRNSEFLTALRPSTGIYCITNLGDPDPTQRPPVLTVDWQLSSGFTTPYFVYWNSAGSNCSGTQYEIRTYQLISGSLTLSDNVAFSIVVP